MLLGCGCNCGGEPPSESTPPSESVPSESVPSESVPLIPDEVNDCQIPCAALGGKKKTIFITIGDDGSSLTPPYTQTRLNGTQNYDYVGPFNPCPPIPFTNGPSPVYGYRYFGAAVGGIKIDEPVSWASSIEAWCSGCSPPTSPGIATGSAGWFSPSLAYCGGDPHSYGVYCAGAGCFPSRVDAKVRYRDQARALGSGSMSLVQKYYDTSISPGSPGHYLDGTGFAALLSTWNSAPLSRQWNSWDNRILGDPPFALPSTQYDDLTAISAAGGSNYADVVSCTGATSPGSPLSSYTCLFMGWNEDSTHLNIMTFTPNCTNTGAGFLLRSWPKFRFSADVLDVFRNAMNNLGREPQGAADCLNAYNWQWFMGIYGTRSGVTRVYPYDDATWIRPNFPVYREKFFGISGVRYFNSYPPVNCSDVIGENDWPAETAIENIKKSGTYQDSPYFGGSGAKPYSPPVIYSGGACEACYDGIARGTADNPAGLITSTSGMLVNPRLGTSPSVLWIGGQITSSGSMYWEDQ